MNVACTPWLAATSRTTRRKVITLSAMVSASVWRRSISCWLGASSWKLYSTGMPSCSSCADRLLAQVAGASLVVRSKKLPSSSGAAAARVRGGEVEELDVGRDVEREALGRGRRACGGAAPGGVALERCAVEVVDVAEHAGLGGVPAHPRDDLEGVGVGDREHVGLLDPREAVDRGPVEGHAVLEGVLELGRADGEALQVAEHVGEPEADEPDPAFFHGAQHVVAVLVEHAAHSPVWRVGPGGGNAERGPGIDPGPPFRRGPVGDGDLGRSRVTCRHGVGADGVGDEPGDRVRIAVGVRATILGVALAVLLDLPRDADRGATVRHAVGELVPRGGLVRR
jgi:hypothetical protein